MARIRTIKPEFWDSPSVAKAGPWARLAFIGMWNWADDYGRGTANLKELEGFIFPNDDTFTDSSGNTVQFRDIIAEVIECFGVLFYTVERRPYYAVTTWETHQRSERRAKASKYPDPPPIAPLTTPYAPVAEIPCSMPDDVAEIPCNSVAGTGEQGNRGTGEQSSSSTAVAVTEETRADIQSICNHLATRIHENGAKRPAIGKTWLTEARLLIDRDGRDFQEIHQIIDWCQNDPFWKPNILSMPKLREKYDQLLLKSRQPAPRQQQSTLGTTDWDTKMARAKAIDEANEQTRRTA